MNLKDLFWPEVQPTAFNKPSEYPGDGPPQFAPQPESNPEVDQFVTDGWEWKGVPQIDRGQMVASGNRELMGLDVISNLPNPSRQALGVPTGGPPGWGTYQLGLLDYMLFDIDYTPWPWYNPVLPLDPRLGYDEPDLSQMYIPSSTE